ncbi:sugar kinase [Streptomyces sp. NBC_01281]|uniref:sugar kinase n=1 Tax=unclassified Streptomyces TaxID=2593676 RepID=UPI00225757AF|nr:MULTISPECIES: sugar kinase [unclassified Streptomyces]MCX5135936.1 sugar kinase [Streptomyces sp. NBC_00340]WSK60366.1 sugar kinase [Streptomyces sp. NBC_01281]
MTASLPRQATSPDEPERPPEDPRHRFRRRALTLLIIVLLIGVPAGYLVISANQSRDSGKDKEEKYSATGLTAGWPSRVQRRLYQIPIPGRSTDVAYYETNNWKTSRLYVQFGTTEAGLAGFLKGVGAKADDLEKDDITIGDRDQKVVGWEFDGPGPWSGLVHKQKDPAPTQDIVVNRSEPGHPMVYVVSRTIP